MAKAKSVKIALLGCGVVGKGTAAILLRDRSLLEERTGMSLELKKILELDIDKAVETTGFNRELFTTDFQTILDDPEIEIVVELIGGTSVAFDFSQKALAAGKHLVTANKAMLAIRGSELMSTARKAGTAIAFEASCGGGIPIIKSLADGLIANRIDALYGIVNGTCNYILTEMIQKGAAYEDVLKDAQAAGLAEADPTLDVTGGDSAHKLTILSSLAFGRNMDINAIPVEGIDKLNSQDVAYGQELGYTIKLLAIAQRKDDGFCLRVRPAFISKEHPLAWVNGAFNAVSVYGHAVGHTMYYGRGAGSSPTASAVVSDIASLAVGSAQEQFKTLRIWPDITERGHQLPPEEIESRYYLRLMVQDQPGVFASVTRVLGEHGISIASALQKEAPQDALHVPVVMTTHPAKEGNICAAIKELKKLAPVGDATCLSIIDEHEEVID